MLFIGDGLESRLLEFLESFAQWTSEGENRDFLIVSDYCVGDEKSANDVFAFSVIRFNGGLGRLSEAIKSEGVKDLKKTSLERLNRDFIDLLASDDVFNMSFSFRSLNKSLIKFFSEENVLEYLTYVSKFLSKSNYPGLELRRKNFKTLINMLKKKNPNLLLIKSITALGGILGLIISVIEKTKPHSKIRWVSDRDKMIDVAGCVAADIGRFEAFTINNFINSDFITPNDMPKSGYNGYDSMITIPDYVSGAVSSYNFEDQSFVGGKIKQSDIFESIFINGSGSNILIHFDGCVVKRRSFVEV